ncbi:hypothetical protein EXN66_Car006039 [Channa argus]|uniref:Uncharacterized protein n=1 Tax=Channa argus TaxID=215402 RepID=A0A6G1PK27_CHAAH|nr:hypothetical protein EXN66_Car006039 [Channa argus]
MLCPHLSPVFSVSSHIPVSCLSPHFWTLPDSFKQPGPWNTFLGHQLWILDLEIALSSLAQFGFWLLICVLGDVSPCWQRMSDTTERIDYLPVNPEPRPTSFSCAEQLRFRPLNVQKYHKYQHTKVLTNQFCVVGFWF